MVTESRYSMLMWVFTLAIAYPPTTTNSFKVCCELNACCTCPLSPSFWEPPQPARPQKKATKGDNLSRKAKLITTPGRDPIASTCWERSEHLQRTTFNPQCSTDGHNRNPSPQHRQNHHTHTHPNNKTCKQKTAPRSQPPSTPPPQKTIAQKNKSPAKTPLANRGVEVRAAATFRRMSVVWPSRSAEMKVPTTILTRWLGLALDAPVPPFHAPWRHSGSRSPPWISREQTSFGVYGATRRALFLWLVDLNLGSPSNTKGTKESDPLPLYWTQLRVRNWTDLLKTKRHTLQMEQKHDVRATTTICRGSSKVQVPS